MNHPIERPSVTVQAGCERYRLQRRATLGSFEVWQIFVLATDESIALPRFDTLPDILKTRDARFHVYSNTRLEWTMEGCELKFHAYYMDSAWFIFGSEWSILHWIPCDAAALRFAFGLHHAGARLSASQAHRMAA